MSNKLKKSKLKKINKASLKCGSYNLKINRNKVFL